MSLNLDRIHTKIELVRVWTYRIIRARYRQSVLGGLWAVLQPAATVAIFSVVFVYFIPVNTGSVPYVLFSYAAMVPWTLLNTSITDMADSLVSNMNLISKIYFPREVLPVASLLARLFDFLIACVLLVILIIYYRIPLSFTGLLILPFILLILLLLALGIGFIGAALNVFYRDVRHIFLLGMQIWFYATPVIYPISSVPEKFLPFYYLNPMAGIITAFRAIIFGQALPGYSILYAAIFSIVIFIAGLIFFKRVESQFADVV
jgi:lipopolysaccharide transport system permease protein